MVWNLRFNRTPVTLQVANPLAVLPEIAPTVVPKSLKTKAPADAADSLEDYDHRQRDREVFQKAGWRFGGSESLAATAPQTKGSRPGTETPRPVFVTDTGDILVGTDVATVQLNAAAMTTEATAKQVLAEDGLTIIHQLSFAPHLYAVRLPCKAPLQETINALQAKPHRYVFAEPSMLQRMSGREMPNDADFKFAWQHGATPDNGGGFGLDSIPAWEITTGRSMQRPVRIAVIDNGMDIAHVDLRGAIVDGGFFTPEEPGAGMATFTRFTPEMAGFPRRGHGTFCLGMVGARRNNGNGGCGVAPDSELIALACAHDQTGNQLTLARAIEFAVNPKSFDPDGPEPLGADIISCSLRTAGVLETVLEMAINSTTSGRGGLGIPLFWAVSNRNNQPISVDKVCSHETVIAVGRSNRDGLPDGSASGPELDFLAPGVDVLGPTQGEDNIKNTGTSFAAPLAAGVAALVMARHPEWPAKKIRERLQDTCDKPIVADRTTIGFGRINAHRAVQESQNGN